MAEEEGISNRNTKNKYYVKMVILGLIFLYGPLLFAQNNNYVAIRDTLVDMVISGHIDEAVNTVKLRNILFKKDFFILGLVVHASYAKLLTDPPIAIQFFFSYYKKDIIKAWESVLKQHPDNIYVLEVLAGFYLSDKPKKARIIAEQVAERDSCASFPYNIYGRLHIGDKEYLLAASEYRKAYLIANKMTDLVNSSYAYMRADECDSALYFYRKIPNTDTINSHYLLGAVLCYLKTGQHELAKSLLLDLKSLDNLRYWDDVVDTLLSYLHRCEVDSIEQADSCVLHLGSLTTVITEELVAFFSTREIVEVTPYKITSPITKKEYRENVCGKGIKQEPYFHIFIDKKGNVEYVFPLISSGNFEVDEYCEMFILRQKFTPSKVFGRPFSSSAVLPIAIIFR